MADVADRLSELAPEIDHDLARMRFERARRDRGRRRRRRRRRIASAGAGVTAAAAAVLVAGSLDLGGDRTTAVTAAGDDAREVHLADLRSRDTRVALAPALADDFEVRAQHAAIHLGPRAWRVDVTRTDGTAAGDEDDCEEPRQTVTGRVGEWLITFSGDGMTASSCRALMDELDDFQVRDGLPVYLGTAPIGPIDDADVEATSAMADFSLFHRRPTCERDAPRSSTGLLVERVDDPARGMPLTVLCDMTASVELWIETQRGLSDEEVDAIEIVTVGDVVDEDGSTAESIEGSTAGTLASFGIGYDLPEGWSITETDGVARFVHMDGAEVQPDWTTDRDARGRPVTTLVGPARLSEVEGGLRLRIDVPCSWPACRRLDLFAYRMGDGASAEQRLIDIADVLTVVGPQLSGSLADGRPWTVRQDLHRGLCVQIGRASLGCDDSGPVVGRDEDPATPRIAAVDVLDLPEEQHGNLVYGFLPRPPLRPTDVPLVRLDHADGRRRTAGISSDPRTGLWAAPVVPGDLPDAVTYLDEAGQPIETYPVFR